MRGHTARKPIFFLFFFSYTYTHIQLSTLASNFSGILFFFAERVRSESEEKGRFPKNYLQG